MELSVAVTVNVKVLAEVGVPVMVPLLASVSPGGKVPAEKTKLMGDVPPVVDIVMAG